jgi:hypothetical protein
MCDRRLAAAAVLLLVSFTGPRSAQLDAPPSAPDLEVMPQHFLLYPGEQIHYTACSEGSKPRCPDAKFDIADPKIVRMIDPKGIFEAVAPGRTELVVQIPTSQRRITVEVAGTAQSPMTAVPYSTVHEITAKDTLLFVGHANLDGFDHTAIAKPGIDRLVQQAKKNRWPVVYFVSKEYPDWYTADRHPDYAIISEGQEHKIHVEAPRVVFSGGDFMACTLRNVQFTLHGMLKQNGARHIDFIFPAQAIWAEDNGGPGAKRPYPAPMVLLTTLFARRANDAQKYDEVVVPFLDRVITQFPVLGYPPDPPTPPLSDLLKDWSIVVRFGSRFERVYRQGDSTKIVLIEFQSV